MSSPLVRRALHDIAADEEALPFADGSLDLAVSALALHFVNDLPGTLIQIRRALKPDGLFLACAARRRHADRVAAIFCRGRSRDRRRRLAARRAVRRSARSRRAAAARGLCACRSPMSIADRALSRTPFGLMHDLRAHGRDQCAGRAPAHAAAARDVAPHGGNLSRAVLPIRTAACARPSRSSGCRAGRRMKASSSRSSRVRRARVSPMRSRPWKFRREKSGTVTVSSEMPTTRSHTCC